MDQEIKRTLWAAADKLRSNMDAAEYKHVVLGLIFLKYISDAFQERRDTLAKEFANPKSDLYIGAGDQGNLLLEDRDYYTEDRIRAADALKLPGAVCMLLHGQQKREENR